MDRQRGALLPLAAGFRLRATQAHLGGVSCRKEVGEVLAEALGWGLTPGREGLSGLPHAKKPARSGLVEGWSIYPPYPVAVPPHLDMRPDHGIG
jgi:hypothetical protein